MTLSVEMFKVLQTKNPGHKKPDFGAWANHIRLMRERDDRLPDQIRELFDWAQADTFWQSNILSPASLRLKWDQLWIKRQSGNGNNGSKGTHQRDTRSRAKRVADRLDEIAIEADKEDSGDFL